MFFAFFSQRKLRHALLGAASAVFAAACCQAGERINQEGRILGPAPTVSSPILFNTAQADAVVSAMQIMPLDSPWNEDVSRLPLLANSDAMIARIMSDLGSSRQTLRAFSEMNYVLVPDSQANVPVTFFNYPDESDPSPYPIPGNLPVESWPVGTGTLTLAQWQQNINGDTGDRHAIMVKPGVGFIWETWLTQLTGSAWQASNGAKFDLKTNTLRPAGWTSGDAAGLPMFPALVRYDECERGMVEHAMRMVVKRSRVGPIYPATHQASVGNTTDPAIPAMGQRVRLKAGFVIPPAWTKEEKAVLLGLKKYGAIVADNGGFFSISVCPDDRFPSGALDHLSTVGIGNFEVVQSTGPSAGPRAAGSPAADAGPDLTATVNTSIPLNGAVSGGTGTVTTGWKFYSGPGSVTFGNASQASTTATFNTVGIYTLMLSASDSVHAVAHDAVVITVTAANAAMDSWKASHFTAAELGNPVISGDNADPDGDGLSNLLEYALGTDPRTGSVTALPIPGSQRISGAEYLSLSFQKLIAANDITYLVEAAGGVGGPWNSADTVAVGTPVNNPGGQTQTLTYRDTFSTSVAMSRFLRLRVTHP